jgi:hypothetical protein
VNLFWAVVQFEVHCSFLLVFHSSSSSIRAANTDLIISVKNQPFVTSGNRCMAARLSCVVRCVYWRETAALSCPTISPRDKVGDTRCFQHRDRTVAQTVERNFACFARLVAAFAGALYVHAVMAQSIRLQREYPGTDSTTRPYASRSLREGK